MLFVYRMKEDNTIWSTCLFLFWQWQLKIL